MKKIITIIILTLAIIPLTCQGFFLDELFDDLEGWISDGDNNNTQIINEIKVEANTGGNVIGGQSDPSPSNEDEGQVEGEEKTSVEIKTIINGEEIEPIDIESSASEVNVESKIEINDEKVSISREIEVGSPAHPPAGEAGSPSDFQAGKEDKGIIKELWIDFVDGLKSIFLGILGIFK